MFGFGKKNEQQEQGGGGGNPFAPAPEKGMGSFPRPSEHHLSPDATEMQTQAQLKEKAGEVGSKIKSMSVSAGTAGLQKTKEGYTLASQKLEHLQWKMGNRQPNIGKTDLEVDMDVLIATAQQVGVRKGWLWKCRHLGHKWSHRYFVQAGSLVVYYEKDTDKNPSGCFLLHSSCVCRALEDQHGGRRYCFEVETPERTYYLSSDSEEDARSWMSCFENATYSNLASSAANERVMAAKVQDAQRAAEQAARAAGGAVGGMFNSAPAPPPAPAPVADPNQAAALAQAKAEAAEWRALAERFKALVDPSQLGPEDKAEMYERLVPKFQALKAGGDGADAWNPPAAANEPAPLMSLI